MLTVDSNFTIENAPEIKKTNILSDIFQTNTVNNAATGKDLSADAKASYEALRKKDAMSLIKNAFNSKEYNITKDDLLNIFEALFKRGVEFTKFRNLIRGLTAAALATLNFIVKIAKGIDRIIEGICNILGRISDFILGLPVITFLKGLIGLILLVGSVCKKGIYLAILNALTDGELKDIISYVVGKAASSLGMPDLLGQVLNHPDALDLSKKYPVIVEDITSTFSYKSKDIANMSDKDREYVEDHGLPSYTYKPEPYIPKKRRKRYVVGITHDQWSYVQSGLDNVDTKRKKKSANGIVEIHSNAYSKEYKDLSMWFNDPYVQDVDISNPDPTKKEAAPAVNDTILKSVKAIFTRPLEIDMSLAT